MAASQRYNDRPLSDALQITDSSKGWTVLAQCLHKSKQRVAASGSNYRNYVFCDMKGTLIFVVTYNQAVVKFARLIHPYNRYRISNAGVRPAKPEFQLGEYPYSWTLNDRTPVDLFSVPLPPTLSCALDFIKFEDMYRYADSEASIAFRALIVGSSLVPHRTNNSFWDYVVVNHEKKPMSLRLWADTLDNEEFNVSSRLPRPTIIVGVNCKITTHHGLSITTKRNSFFLHDPPYPESDPLLAWYARNATEVKKLVDDGAHLDVDKLLPPPSDEIIVSITDFKSNRDTIKASWIAATMYLLPSQERLWYIACHNCGKSFDALVGWKTTCTSCGKETAVQPRCHIGIFLNDETGALEATMLSPEVEKLTHFSGAQIKEAADKNAPLTNEIEKRIHKKPVICFVKHVEKMIGGVVKRSWPIVKLYTEQEIAAARASKNVQAGTSSTAVGSLLPAHILGEKEKQFFSPYTKLAIEEIAVASANVQKPSGVSLGPKRSMLFHDLCAEDLSEVLPPLQSPAPCNAQNTSYPAPGIVQSIGKKVRREEDM